MCVAVFRIIVIFEIHVAWTESDFSHNELYWRLRTWLSLATTINFRLRNLMIV